MNSLLSLSLFQYSAAYSSDSALSLPPPSSEESQSEPDSMSPVPEEVAMENMSSTQNNDKTYPGVCGGLMNITKLLK